MKIFLIAIFLKECKNIFSLKSELILVLINEPGDEIFLQAKFFKVKMKVFLIYFLS